MVTEQQYQEILARLEAHEGQLAARGEDGPARTRRAPYPARRKMIPRRWGGALIIALLLASAPLGILASDRYPDVPSDYFHHDDINLIADAGITRIQNGEPYRPFDPVTRGEMASFLARTAGLGSNPPVVNAKAAQTAGTIANQANSATIPAGSANTGGQIVLRDANGNFSAGTITANLNGTATNATTAQTALGRPLASCQFSGWYFSIGPPPNRA